jgi:thiol-disulfide isomerase/thioredoxin
MKTKIFLLTAFIGGLFFISCNKIDQPYPQVNVVDTSNTNVNFNDTVLVSNNNVKRILLEDYTGHECGNCPQAAELAEQLYTSYPNHISLLAVHAGHFAEPDAFNPLFALDLTTEDGDLYDNEFGNSAKGNPNGMINRTQYAVGNYVVKPAQWTTIIDSLAGSSSNSPSISFDLTSIYNTESRVIRLLSTLTINKDLPTNYNLISFFYESGILGNHKKYDGGQTLILENYEFNHVLRKAIPTSWGKDLITGGASINEVIEDEIAFTIPETWSDDNVGVILCLFERTTKEVLQTVEVKHIKKP